jgi:Na+-translocating ferredoxin:NAD+ oxidoreductase RNF subunit RnfB
MNLNKQYRPSAEELLSDSRIFNDIEADDTEFAIWIVKRNRNAVKQCFQSCPNDARLLSNQTLNGGINIFFAVLVGEYYRTPLLS